MDTWSNPIVVNSDVAEEVEALNQIKNDDE